MIRTLNSSIEDASGSRWTSVFMQWLVGCPCGELDKDAFSKVPKEPSEYHRRACALESGTGRANAMMVSATRSCAPEQLTWRKMEKLKLQRRWHTSLEPPQLRQHFRRLQQRGYDSHNSTSSSSSSSSSDSDDDMDGTNLHTTNATGNNQAKKERASDGGESDDP